MMLLFLPFFLFFMFWWDFYFLSLFRRKWDGTDVLQANHLYHSNESTNGRPLLTLPFFLGLSCHSWLSPSPCSSSSVEGVLSSSSQAHSFPYSMLLLFLGSGAWESRRKFVIFIDPCLVLLKPYLYSSWDGASISFFLCMVVKLLHTFVRLIQERFNASFPVPGNLK